MEASDDIFVINTEEDKVEEVPVAQTEESAKETAAEAMERVKGLVPLCTQHLHGPQLSSATFGYDIAQMAKRPWAEPGAKLSDYFNYGFNEQSWRVYCAMQKNGEESLLAKASEMLQKLEATGRPSANVAADEGAAGEASMHPFGGMPEGYGANLYVNPNAVAGGGGGFNGAGSGYNNSNNNVPNRPYQQRDFYNNNNNNGGVGGGHGAYGGGQHNANYKTRLCKSFAEGHCNRGDACNYAHGVAELRQPGGGAPNQPSMNPGSQPPQQQQQQQMNGGGGNQGYGNAAAFYPAGSAPAPPERTANYLMPPFQPGANMPPMMQPNTMQQQQQQEGGEAGSGFRQPPKRQRQEGSGVYEPQY